MKKLNKKEKEKLSHTAIFQDLELSSLTKNLEVVNKMDCKKLTDRQFYRLSLIFNQNVSNIQFTLS